MFLLQYICAKDAPQCNEGRVPCEGRDAYSRNPMSIRLGPGVFSTWMISVGRWVRPSLSSRPNRLLDCTAKDRNEVPREWCDRCLRSLVGLHFSRFRPSGIAARTRRKRRRSLRSERRRRSRRCAIRPALRPWATASSEWTDWSLYSCVRSIERARKNEGTGSTDDAFLIGSPSASVDGGRWYC